MGDFGGKLRLARERRGISLVQIAATTKISVAVLEALERNDISKLPGGIFGRAFVRSYAAEVGLDPDLTVQEFVELFHTEPVRSSDIVTTIPEEESSFESQQRIARVVFLLVLISLPLIGVVLYFTLRGQRTAPQPAAVAAEPAAPPPISGTAAVPTNPPAAAAIKPPPAAVPAANASAATARAIRLDLHPTGDCWINLTVDGQPVFSRLMRAGEQEVRDVRESAVIEVGNAGAFAYSINGRPGKVLGAEGQVRTARITRETLAEYIQ
jgi:cytoskeleton protein RodZ